MSNLPFSVVVPNLLVTCVDILTFGLPAWEKTHQVIGNLMFESKFQNIISRVGHQRKIIDEELKILTLRQFVEIQNSLSHQAQTATKITDHLHGQTCSTDKLLQAIHTLNEATTNQSQNLAKQLAEYRKLQETQHPCSGGLRLVLAVPCLVQCLICQPHRPMAQRYDRLSGPASRVRPRVGRC